MGTGNSWNRKNARTTPIGNWTEILLRLKNANLILIAADKGFVACGYSSIETTEKLGDALALVTGVNSFDDVLNSRIIKTNSKAREFGITEGMTGREALERLS